VESHRNYPPEDRDGRWYPGDRGYPEPEWDRRGGDQGYQPAPGEQSFAPAQAPASGAGYGNGQYAEAPAAYGDPPQYRDPGQRYADPEHYRVPEPRYQGLDEPPHEPGQRTGELPPKPADPPSHMHTEALPQLPPDTGLPPLPGADGQGVRHSTEQLDRAALRRPTSGGPGPLGDGVYRSRRPGTAAAVVILTVLFELVAVRVLGYSLFTRTSPGGAIAASFLVLGLPMFGLGMYGLLGGAAAAPGAGSRAWLRTPLVYLPMALLLFLAAGLAAS